MKLYKDILELREVADLNKKGFLFEQAIREIQPWDYKPPISALARSEQFDGIYTWKGITFLIESKAKIGEIKAGSHDWEDFELKVTKRIGKGVIGIFCSLYPVNKGVFESAKELNIRGGEVMVFDGYFWEELADGNIEFEVVLEYMLPQIRLKNNPRPPKISEIQSWATDIDQIQSKFFTKSSKSTSKFLRRYKHKYHESTYVERDIDKLINQYLNILKPTSLRKLKHEDDELPKQIIILRDVSGSGKTTLTVNLSNQKEKLCIAGTCKDIEIDTVIYDFVESIGIEKVISNLNILNKPLLFVLDSLDEAKKNYFDKRQEILGLFRYLKELNKDAKNRELLVFPLLILITVRDDYWRDWENLFEDRKIEKFTKRYSTFTGLEFTQALKKYENAYNFQIANPLSNISERTLSSPINLSIFSESHEFEGLIHVDDIWQEKILYKYFERKKDDILKHPIPNLTGSLFMKILSEIAFKCIELKDSGLEERFIQEILNEKFQVLSHYSDEVLALLRSEQVLVKEIEDKALYRFRHSRFLEYLCAFYIVNIVHTEKKISPLEKITDQIFESGISLMWSVHDCIRYISRVKFPAIFKKIDDFYASSEKFMGKKILYLRGNIAVGYKVSNEDLDLIMKNSSSNNNNLNFDGFFVISAVNNKQEHKRILELFELGWRNNINRPDRWKMLIKINQHKLLLNEKILNAIVTSANPKEWEVFLGYIIEDNSQRKIIKDLFESESFAPNNMSGESWNHVIYLMDLIRSGKEFIKGKENK